MTNSRTAALSLAGVSIWLDDLSRERLDSGSLSELVGSLNVVGVTTNPTIFAGAIGAGQGYQERIRELAGEGLSVEDAAFALMSADVRDACDLLTDTFHVSKQQDGRVSLEVSPDIAHDSAATTAQAQQLWQQVARPNAMIKIPATEAGLDAIADSIAAGISVNVTLIFSLARYRQVINAYLSGLERARQAGHDLRTIHSVASFFVSRLDSAIDPRLSEIGTEEALSLRGKAGLANARLAYEVFEQTFSSERAQLRLAAGANVQRPLWASTGVKDPAYPDTLYVSGLVAAQVVNTMPEATLLAFADHGDAPNGTITAEYRESDQILNALDALGIDYGQTTEQLEREAVQKFQASWHELLDKVRAALGEAH